uniref:Uncharacterized protein n=1 Tax=Siphoviridae sp. ct1TR2 TaxID=2825309 RepID=A0A8S5NU96_9CAUD|nr:MAG TPA: hypothetical protein [Siphoviridae sp. ct1TR2]
MRVLRKNLYIQSSTKAPKKQGFDESFRTRLRD